MSILFSNNSIKIVIENDTLQQILIYCDIETLYNCLLTSKLFHITTTNILESILTILLHRYYSRSTPPPISHDTTISIYKKVKRLATQSIIIIRGIVTYKLELSTRSWSRRADTRRDRGYFAAIVVKGYIYAISTLSKIAQGTVEKYNPFNNTWQNVENLPKTLEYTAACVINDIVYVIGGCDSKIDQQSESVYTHEDHDPGVLLGSEFWQNNTADLLTPRSRHAATVYKSHIWVAGGRTALLPCTTRFIYLLLYTATVINYYSHYYYYCCITHRH